MTPIDGLTQNDSGTPVAPAVGSKDLLGRFAFECADAISHDNGAELNAKRILPVLERLVEELAPLCQGCKTWEAEIDELYQALHVKLNEETVDIACGQAKETIACLKHVAIEMAAHGDCHCSQGDGFCAYCVACKLVDGGIQMSREDGDSLIDAIQAQRLNAPADLPPTVARGPRSGTEGAIGG